MLSLERRGLITATPTSSLANHSEYAFKHALVRDVAYSSLPKARRARAHAEIGAWIEELAGGRTDEFGELLAFHYLTAAAGEDADLAWSESERKPIREKAFGHLISAGAQARRRFAVSRSIELHQQAVSIAATDGGRLTGDRIWERAVGPFQFIPSAWAIWRTDAHGATDAARGPAVFMMACLICSCPSGATQTTAFFCARA